MRLFALKYWGQGQLTLTMPTVQKFSDDGSTAGGPGAGAVDLNKRGRHHVVVLQFPKHVLTGLHIVVGHIEHMSCREGERFQMSFMNTQKLLAGIVHMPSHYRDQSSTNVYLMMNGVGRADQAHGRW